MTTLYHVAPAAAVGSIFVKGIRARGRRGRPTWHGTFGAALGDPLAVYAFTDRDDAIRWAGKQRYDGGAEVAIVVFEDDLGVWTEDPNPTLPGRSGVVSYDYVGGPPRQVPALISPERVVRAERVPPEMVRGACERWTEHLRRDAEAERLLGPGCDVAGKEHEWAELPGEPPVEVCVQCGATRS